MMPVHSDFFFCACALILGLVAGMRTVMAPAVFALALSRRPELVPPVSPAQWFTPLPLANLLGLAALGELVTDKLPRTPNRTAFGPFIARLVSGAVTGAAVVQVGRINLWFGVVCGAIGALVGTFGMFHVRRFVGRVTRIRDPFIGAMEDIIAIALAVSVVASLAV